MMNIIVIMMALVSIVRLQNVLTSSKTKSLRLNEDHVIFSNNTFRKKAKSTKRQTTVRTAIKFLFNGKRRF